jgi:membrane associated rhomboid family serine protease
MPATPSTRAPHDAIRTSLRGFVKGCASAPATSAYVLVLVITTAILSSSSERSEDQLLFAVSTNLHQLADVPIRVLVASAFWTSGWSDLALTIVLFAAILAPVERRLGSRRMLLAFAAGHLGATLIVAAGLWIGIHLGAVPQADVVARDVGVSYGFFAVAALAGYLLDRRYRIGYFAAIAGYLVAEAALHHTFTDFGHLSALAIGLACYPIVDAKAAPLRARLPRRVRRRVLADASTRVSA